MNFESYEDCLSFLYRRNQFAIKLGLLNIKKLIESRGVDFKRSKYIHVAGTNGKGSVCHFLGQILKTRQYRKIGIYTSPHLVSFRERITINEKVIPRNWILGWMNSAHSLLLETKATFFECVTIMALEYFYETNCDICILETGLGGRLDATNAVESDLTVLTSVSMDHESILGHSLSEIAWEKLGILKKDIPLVLSESNNEILRQVERVAIPLGVKVRNTIDEFSGQEDLVPGVIEGKKENHYVYRDRYAEVAIKGNFKNRNHMLNNLALSIFAIHVWESSRKIPIPNQTSITTEPPLGRTQCLQAEGLPPVILDCAHNENSLKELANYIEKSFPRRKITFLFSIMKDKNLYKIVEQVFEVADDLLFESLIDFDRSLKYSELREYIPKKNSIPFRAYNLAEENVLTTLAKLDPDKDLLAVAGSFYLLGRVIPQLSEKYLSLAFFHQFSQDFISSKIMV